MFRNLIILIAIVALVWIVRGIIRRNQLKEPGAPRQQKNQDMVQCALCQTYVPKDEAQQYDDHFFCGTAHLQDWKNRH
jgi:hypothetical protein